MLQTQTAHPPDPRAVGVYLSWSASAAPMWWSLTNTKVVFHITSVIFLVTLSATWKFETRNSQGFWI